MKNLLESWKFLLIVFSVLTVLGILFLGPEIADSFSLRFFRSGIFQILGPALGAFIFYKTVKAVKADEIDAAKVWKPLALGTLLFWAGLFGPNVGFREDKKASIPKVQVYYGNGKVINATDSNKTNYYFNEFTLNSEDSVYVVTYGEEPGYNVVWKSFIGNDESLKSKAPRANEDWKRPVTNDAKEFEDGKRQK
jgi:hypothetical protein